MTKIIDVTGKGAAINASENDNNLSSLSGINEAQVLTSYTMTIDDQNRTIEHSNASAIAVTLTQISTIAAALHTDDFACTHKNVGAGLVTLTCGGSDTFDSGSTTLVLKTGQSITIETDSTGAIWNRKHEYANSYSVGARPLVLIESITASTSASLDFITGIDATYDVYILEFINLVPSAQKDIYFKVSDDTGATWKGGTSYNYAGQANGTAQTATGAAFIPLNITLSSVSNTASHGGLNGEVRVYNPASASFQTNVLGHINHPNSSSALFDLTFSGTYAAAATIDGFQIIAESGNLASGTVNLYGLTK